MIFRYIALSAMALSALARPAPETAELRKRDFKCNVKPGSLQSTSDRDGWLSPGDCMVSNNGEYALLMTKMGTLIHMNRAGKELWKPDIKPRTTSDTHCRVQADDGNFVWYIIF
jgi:hypothetical protein